MVTAMSDERTYLRAWVSTQATEELKRLLEDKHLYQKFALDMAEVVGKLTKNVSAGPHRDRFSVWVRNELPEEKFSVLLHQLSMVPRVSTATQTPPQLWITLPHPSLYCNSKGCKRRETFTPIWFTELTQAMATTVTPKQVALPGGFQLFTLAYQCQRCLGRPEAFLVRRDKWTFFLEGRSPIERVEVPNFVPEKENHYYSDAIVAFNSGKVLAGLFYLRTFVEQFARRVTKKTGRATGEEILDAYYETLPANLKSTMPSLREWYENLSVPIHAGKDDTEVFAKAKEAVDKHFEIRRVFGMDATVQKTAEAVSKAEPAEAGTAREDQAESVVQPGESPLGAAAGEPSHGDA
jgi:hypothetical protein